MMWSLLSRETRCRATRVWALTGVLVAAGLVGPVLPATAVTIDSFTTNQAAVTDPPGNAPTVVTGGADIVGTRRALAADLVRGAGPVTTSVAGGVLNLTVTNTAPDSHGWATVTWDGDAVAADFNPIGLSGLDLTAGGHNGLRFVVNTATAGAELELDVYTSSTSWARGAIRLPAVVGATGFVLSYQSDFVQMGTSFPSFNNVGGIVLRVRGTEVTVNIDLIETVGPAVTAAKVDLTSPGDAPIGAAQQAPGTTIKHRVTITNAGAQALSVDLADTLEANFGTATNVLATPIAARDSYYTVGHVDKVVAAGQGVLANDFDPDVLGAGGLAASPVGNIATALGGNVVMAADGSFTYDAPVGFGPAVDSFSYTLTDNDGQTATGQVVIALGQKVWFVDEDADVGAGNEGDGTFSNPFGQIIASQLSGAGGAGDLDGERDIIYVRSAASALVLAGAFELEAHQRLLGGFLPLSIDGQLVEPGGGTRPAIDGGANDAIRVTQVMPLEIGGLNLRTTSPGSGSAIDVTTATTLGGSPSLWIHDNQFAGAGDGGVDVNFNPGTVGGLALEISANGWVAGTHTGNGIDVSRAAGQLQLNINNNTNIASQATAINIDGDTVGSSTAGTVISSFLNNQIHQDTGGSGIVITDATFDAQPSTVAYEQVSGGATIVGIPGNGVGVTAMALNNVRGDLRFVDLDLFGASGLVVTGTGVVNTGAGTGTQVGVPASVATVEATAGPAVNISSATVDLPVQTLSSTTTTSGVSLTNVAGTFSAPSGSSITKSSGAGAAFAIDNSAVGTTALTSTYNGTINNSSSTGRSVSVNAADTGSAVSFTGQVTDSPGQGVNLTSNTGASITFSGGLTLSTGANTAFNATGGGTIAVCDENPCNAAATGALVNTLATTTGTALNVTSTTIGSNNLEFRAISAGTGASGPANGIVLNTTGASGGLKVKGTGSAASGGTIQETTSHGVLLTSTNNVELNRVVIQSADDDGIFGTTVNGFTLANSSVINNGNSTADEGIYLVDPAGAITLTNVTATGNAHNNAWIYDTNNTGGNSSLALSGGSFSSTGNANGNMGLLVDILGTAVLGTSSISGATISNNKVIGLQVLTGDSSTISDLTISGNTFQDTGTGNSQEISMDVSKAGTSNMTVKVLNNTGITGHNSHGMNFFTATGAGTTGTYNLRVSGNTIGNAAVAGSGSLIGNCMRVNINGDADASVLIDGNVLRQCPNGRGIEVIGRNGTGGLDVTVTNNDVNTNDVSGFPLAGILVQSNDVTVANTVRSDVRGNTVLAGTAFDVCTTFICVVETGTSTSQLVDTAPASASCTAQLTSTNTGSASGSAGCALIAGPISTPP